MVLTLIGSVWGLYLDSKSGCLGFLFPHTITLELSSTVHCAQACSEEVFKTELKTHLFSVAYESLPVRNYVLLSVISYWSDLDLKVRYRWWILLRLKQALLELDTLLRQPARNKLLIRQWDTVRLPCCYGNVDLLTNRKRRLCCLWR